MRDSFGADPAVELCTDAITCEASPDGVGHEALAGPTAVGPTKALRVDRGRVRATLAAVGSAGFSMLKHPAGLGGLGLGLTLVIGRLGRGLALEHRPDGSMTGPGAAVMGLGAFVIFVIGCRAFIGGLRGGFRPRAAEESGLLYALGAVIGLMNLAISLIMFLVLTYQDPAYETH